MTATPSALQDYYLTSLVTLPTSVQNYTLLKEETVHPWQKMLIDLNLASLYLAEQQWEPSALLLEVVPLDPETPADVLRALWQNRALAHWLEALEQKKSSHRADQEDALELLKLSLYELQAAKQSAEWSQWSPELTQQIREQSRVLSGYSEQAKHSLKGAKAALKNLIILEQKNLKTVLWQQVKDLRDGDVSVTQEKLVAQAGKFLPQLIKEQEGLYYKEGLCQCRPWDQVIPLFEEGLKHAQAAGRALRQNPVELSTAALSLRRTLIDWKKALQLFEEKQSPVPQESQMSESSNVQEIWRSLQKASSSETPSEPVGIPPQNFGERQW